MIQNERSNDAPGGRPDAEARADPESTRAALLQAGRSLFARRGYDGASIRAITQRANANLGAVSYHFGSKEALYGAVLEEVLGPLADKVTRAADPGGSGGPATARVATGRAATGQAGIGHAVTSAGTTSPTAEGGTSVERVLAVVRAFFGHLDDYPELPQLMLQEIAAGKAPPPPVESFLRTVTGSLARVIGEGQEAGEIRRGDPVLLGLSCVIQPIHLTLVRHWLGLVKRIDPGDPGQRAHLVDHAEAFARAGLAMPGAGPPIAEPGTAGAGSP